MTWVTVSESVRARLAKIEQRHGGRLRPADVVDDARNPNSPLHYMFTWDKNEASERYWLTQARAIIANVRVIQKTTHTQVRTVYYIRDPSARPSEAGYVSIPTLLSDDELTRQAIINELDLARNMLRRTRALADVIHETDDIDELVEKLEDVRERFVGRKKKRRPTHLRVAR